MANIPCNGVTSHAVLRSYFLTLRDKFRDKLLSATAKRMLSTAGNEPRVRSIQQQVESTTPSWLLVFHLFKKVQVKNQQPRWCTGLNLLSYAWKPRFDPCCAQHSFHCCTKQLVSELVSQYDRSVATRNTIEALPQSLEKVEPQSTSCNGCGNDNIARLVDCET